MKWIGLTGGIATGKSTAKKILQQLGHPVIDADLITHEISKPGEIGFNEIVKHFSRDILTSDGLLDRKKLGEIIFRNESERLRLESILHPLIQIEVQQQRQVFESQGNKLCFYDVPLLFEKKLQNQFFSTVFIWCDYETQLARLIARSSLTPEQAISRIRSQLSLVEKIPLANHCLDNSTTVESLKLQIKVLLLKL